MQIIVYGGKVKYGMYSQCRELQELPINMFNIAFLFYT